MTSVKEFRVETDPTADELGRGRFVFTNQYSVFDWGEMPDHVPKKGASLCTMGAFNFELLEVNDIPTHYVGVIEDGETTDLKECESPPTEMVIELTQVPDLPYVGGSGADAYDYDAYHEAADENYLIPLEIVFRNTVPVGSSLRTRGEPADYGLDADAWPDEAVSLPEPVVEFSTKYEEQDRYLDREEAESIAGRAELDRLEELALSVNHILNERAERAGFTHEDGKIECLYHDGTIKVADVVGTFDENRFSYDGQEVSKEVVRQYYKRTDPEWVEAVSEAKDRSREEGVADWRTLCEKSPDNLPASVLTAVSEMYAAGTNGYTDSEWFDAPTIEDAVERVRGL
ncbi:phosphoribosylaminoimidazole-succinocarboxamide synthase [Halogeometricum borinquense DSM 11551]|uniref:Phosphoribosylaminoimidazole-succinocarboxamide synthase n=1 Tax=Halogeometricum borinquense (strain ATCC 700274 / DSM 11551 / JCM 10706 / KCTC 4070 / PR3) TaxID=469382 RepID=E4NMS6_HALBP|nr:phosphoribosylaminoimidazolesuccinocarboxamide synthase [Halogeometricum borinquense]ADQ66231.1 phosphoribosylaminoimidazolesuccinocarboxamide (SAICAR) synthase [Halogeometricum borinquense DSM 11551]ELY27274.1 phosphoribosylaminoimidazole-succinocarboxamide synthase [Halogeometricum borinquense DSM 11551]